MAYTLEDVRTMVMDIVGEDSSAPTYWTTARVLEIDDWINDAAEEVCTVLGLYTEEVRIPLYANRRYYMIDSGKGSQLLWFKHMRIEPEGYYLNGTDPTALSRDDFNWMTRTGTPASWYPVGVNAVRFVPYPASDGQLIEATIVCIPKTYISDDARLDVPDHFIHAIVSYAAFTLLLIQRRYEKAAYWVGEYGKVTGMLTDRVYSQMGRALMPKGIGDVAK